MEHHCHPKGFESFYIRVDYTEDHGFRFDPHCLDVPFNIAATLTWYTENPNLVFTGFNWCNENEHLSHRPLIRGNCIVGSVQTAIAVDDVYWKYQVEADVTLNGVTLHVCSTPCSAATDGLPRIHPK